jgi:hypothetical protein
MSYLGELALGQLLIRCQAVHCGYTQGVAGGYTVPGRGSVGPSPILRTGEPGSGALRKDRPQQ